MMAGNMSNEADDPGTEDAEGDRLRAELRASADRRQTFQPVSVIQARIAARRRRRVIQRRAAATITALIVAAAAIVHRKRSQGGTPK